MSKALLDLTEVKNASYKPKIISLVAKNTEQKRVLKSIKENRITIIYGPAGTGKTHLSTIYALKELMEDRISKIIFTRPCVEAYGEKLGYLPGNFNQKIGPYMIPIFDIISRTIPIKDMNSLIKLNKIQTIPLAFQRGLTFHDAIVIGDEFQNTVPEQVRMFLTRMGDNCKIIVTGDPEQNDIKGKNGLVDAVERLQNIEGISIIKMTCKSLVRDPLVNIIDKRYSSSTGEG